MQCRTILALSPCCLGSLAVLSGLLVGCQDKTPTPPDKEEIMEAAAKPQSPVPQDAAIEIARQYVEATKQWPETDFHLEFLRQEGTAESPIMVIDAVHHDDLRSDQKGGGKSVQLHVDLRENRVAKELAYQ